MKNYIFSFYFLIIFISNKLYVESFIILPFTSYEYEYKYIQENKNHNQNKELNMTDFFKNYFSTPIFTKVKKQYQFQYQQIRMD